jgi:hypothetical protein
MKYLPQSEYSHLSQNEITTPSPLPHDQLVRQYAVLSIHPIQIHHNQFDQHSTLYTTTSSNNSTSVHTIYNTTQSHLISSHFNHSYISSFYLILSYHTIPFTSYEWQICAHYTILLTTHTHLISQLSTTVPTMKSNYANTIVSQSHTIIQLLYILHTTADGTVSITHTLYL